VLLASKRKKVGGKSVSGRRNAPALLVYFPTCPVNREERKKKKNLFSTTVIEKKEKG